tara:strand:- start:264 stop:479 length:216 start_codon:yes stop_codon:yes gene_type:complete
VIPNKALSLSRDGFVSKWPLPLILAETLVLISENYKWYGKVMMKTEIKFIKNTNFVVRIRKALKRKKRTAG